MKKIKMVVLIATLLIIINVNQSIYAVSSAVDINDSISGYSSFRDYSDELTKKVDTSLKIYDYANLFSDTEEVQLKDSVEQFIYEYDMDMVIVTIDYNNKLSSMAYADDFYDYNGFGRGLQNDGILFLIDMDKRNMWISTTGRAISVYNDTRIDTILDFTYNKIKNKEYAKCAEEFVKYAKIYAQRGASGSDSVMTMSNAMIISILVGTLATLIYTLTGINSLKTAKKQRTAQNYVKNFTVTGARDMYSHKNVSRVYNPPSSSSSSGGSSTHFGSSGVSHGGGGRSF